MGYGKRRKPNKKLRYESKSYRAMFMRIGVKYLGEIMANQLYQAANRRGFASRILYPNKPKPVEIPESAYWVSCPPYDRKKSYDDIDVNTKRKWDTRTGREVLGG